MRGEKFAVIFNWGLLAAILAVALPDSSWAQTVNQVITNFQKNTMAVFPNLLSAGAYIGGAVLGVSGALKLKAHAENPAAEKMAPGLARLIAGGAIAAAPAILNTLQSSTELGTSRAQFLDWNPGF